MIISLVDIETTGGSFQHDRIVEIAILRIENNQLVDRFQRLINPGRDIPYSVSLIHGLRNEDVEHAPTFEDIADEILDFLADTVFVAHSVQFDFGFIKAEFERIGIDLDLKKICTVRLAKKLLPQLKSHSLANLCHHFGITNLRAHRAMEDAEATADIWFRLSRYEEFDATISFFLKKGAKEMRLPAQISPERLSSLPEKPGIYRFLDEKGMVIYVGKATNLKDRVGQHLMGQTHTRGKSRFLQLVYDVDVQETGSDFMALLIENELIKRHFPKFNSTNKSFHLAVGIFSYHDQLGYLRLCIGPAGKWTNPLIVYPNSSLAFNELVKLSMAFGLCLKLNGLLEKEVTHCQYKNEDGSMCLICSQKQSSEEYNKRATQLIQRHFNKGSFMIKTAGRITEELGLIWVENGKLMGYGFYPGVEFPKSLAAIKTFLNPYYDTTDSQWILNQFLPNATSIGFLENDIQLLAID